MQQIFCHQCNRETSIKKQLIGGEIRSCSEGHEGIYNDRLQFVRPAPNLNYKSQYSNPAPPKPTVVPQQIISRNAKPINYDINVLCSYCKGPTYIIQKDEKVDIDCGGCGGSGYYRDDDKVSDFVCIGCDGEGSIRKIGEKRSCAQNHLAFYSKGKFVHSYEGLPK